MSPAVTVVGSINLDLLVSVPHLPRPGETVVGSDVTTAPGGKGANQAAAAGALSDSVAMVGRIGSDGVGTQLRDDLSARGVDVSELLVVEGPTGHATIAVEAAGGENLIIVAPGANSRLSPADVDVAVVRDASIVLAQLEIPLETVVAAAAVTTGRFVLNPAPPQELPAELLARVDVLVPNETELARLCGEPLRERSVDEVAELARRVAPGADVVVTLGARGALAVLTGTGEAWLVAPPPVTPIDTTGAGDCFNGALCVALADGADLVSAVRQAVAAAALSTTGAGARGGLPDRQAVAAILPKVGERVAVGAA
jgi:ribokinase